MARYQHYGRVESHLLTRVRDRVCRITHFDTRRQTIQLSFTEDTPLGGIIIDTRVCRAGEPEYDEAVANMDMFAVCR